RRNQFDPGIGAVSVFDSPEIWGTGVCIIRGWLSDQPCNHNIGWRRPAIAVRAPGGSVSVGDGYFRFRCPHANARQGPLSGSALHDLLVAGCGVHCNSVREWLADIL